LAVTINNQRELVKRMELDQGEAEVLAVIELLGSVGPRMYLNFLDEANKKRVRNAWDRFDRKKKNPKWATLLCQTLMDSERKNYDRRINRQDWRRLIKPDDTRGNVPAWAECAKSARPGLTELAISPCTCGAADRRFCTCRRSSGPIGGSWANPFGGSMHAADPGNFDVVVRLDCDLQPEEKRIYGAYEKKHNKKLYSP